MIDERLAYLMAMVKVLEVSFVNELLHYIGELETTPQKHEFNLISVDIFLRHTEHKFLFANPKQLESSGADANHLQQNYIMGFVFTDRNGNLELAVTEEWYENIEEACQTINLENAINEQDMQEDIRNITEKDF
jgi:hypothetical protein